MGDAGAEDAELEGAVAMAETVEVFAMDNIVHAFDSWKQASSTASKSRRNAHLATANRMEQLAEEAINRKVQEVEKRMEEKTNRKVQEVEKRMEEKINRNVQEVEKRMEEKINRKVQEVEKRMEEKTNRKVQEVEKRMDEKINRNVQEVEKRMEEKINHIVKTTLRDMKGPFEETMVNRMESVVQKRVEEEMKKRYNNAVVTKPPATRKSSQVSNERPLQPMVQAGSSASAKRPAQSHADSEFHSGTPSKHLRPPRGDSTTPTLFVGSANQPASSPLTTTPSRNPPKLARLQRALRSAVKDGRIDDIINYLDFPVNPNFTDEEGNTLLHIAAGSAQTDVIQVLLDSGQLQVDAVDSTGQTALHVAASHPHGASCVLCLLIRKADVNRKDAKGDTPLHCAARNGKKEIVDMIIEKKADINAKNNDGHLPVDVAKKNVRNLLRPSD